MLFRSEELLSTWIPTSELSRVNAAAGVKPVHVSPETLTVVQPEPGMSERSNGQGAAMETVRQRLAPTAGDERQLWLGMALGVSDQSSLVTAVRVALATKVGQAGTHLLLMNGPAIP